MAYTYQVPVTYTVNVSLTQTPSGLAGYNTNSIAIFSNEPANTTDSYIRALSPDTIKAAYGSNSLTYKMALALYTPVPNFRTGNGTLYVFPYGGINATGANVKSQAIDATILENLESVTDGKLTITIEGTDYTATDLDFSGILTVADVVKILNNVGFKCSIEVVDTNKIKFTSKLYGTSSSIALKATSAGTGTDLYSASYLGASLTPTAGTNASGDTLNEAVSDALQQVYFGGVLTTQYMDNAALLSASSAIQSMDCIYYNELESLDNITVLGTQVKTAGNSKTRLLAYSLGKEDAKIAIATYATIAQSVNYNGTDTANTLNLKTLTGVLPDTGLSDTYVLNAQENGVDIYGNTGGLSVVYSNDNNGYTDDITATLRFKKDIEVGGFNYLRQTSTKIPQTEKGMTGLKNAYGLVCERFVNNGVIAAGTWNNSIPFGDPDAFQRNIQEKGYYIYSIPVALQAQEEREKRIAPLVQIAVKLSGAFHFSDVIINIQR